MKKLIIFAAMAIIATVSCNKPESENKIEQFSYEEYEQILNEAIADGAKSFELHGRETYIINLPVRQKGNQRVYGELIAVKRDSQIDFGGDTFRCKDNRKYDFYERCSVKEVNPEKVDRPVHIRTIYATAEDIVNNPTWVLYRALDLSNAGERDVKLPLENGEGTVYLTVEENGTYKIWFRGLIKESAGKFSKSDGLMTISGELFHTYLRTITLHEGDASTMYTL